MDKERWRDEEERFPRAACTPGSRRERLSGKGDVAMKIDTLLGIIEEYAPLDGAASWDKSGMQVAARRDRVTALAVSLDPVPQSVSRAVAMGADVLLTHHPLLLSPRLPDRVDNLHTVLSQLFCADVALYAAHTSLDVNAHGPAGWLAETLAMRDCQLLEPTARIDGREYGFGLAGTLRRPLTPDDLLEILGAHIALDTACWIGHIPERIARVAYCTGSGSSLLARAAAAQADIFITGDVKYHTALESPLGILDVGHHSLEEEMMRRFALLLQERLLDIPVHFIASASPFRPALREKFASEGENS